MSRNKEQKFHIITSIIRRTEEIGHQNINGNELMLNRRYIKMEICRQVQ